MKILVISSNLIGDTVLSTGVVEHFAKAYPKAKFTFLAGPSAGQIYDYFPLRKEIILFKKKRFNIHWLDMYRFSKNKKWEIIIDFRSSLLPYFLKKNKKYIFKKNKLLSHLMQLNETFKFDSSNLFINNSFKEKNEVNLKINKNYKYVVIFPGGNWKPKIWSTEYYNKLMFFLLEKFSNIKFIIVGSSKERIIYDKIIKGLSADLFIDLMGKTLTLTSAYMKKSTLFIGNDSGLMHLSVASQLTTIGLFGPTNDNIYGHRSLKSFVIRTDESYEYFNKSIINPNISYMSSIKPEHIIDLIIQNKLL